MSIRKITKKQAIELATESYYETKIHEYVFNVPMHPEMGYGRARRGEIAGKGIREVWDTSKLWKPICMDTPLVLASFAGDKTETRRLLKTSKSRKGNIDKELGPFLGKPVSMSGGYVTLSGNVEDGHGFPFYVYPKNEVGDLLYVRERWQGYKINGFVGGIYTEGILFYNEVDKIDKHRGYWRFVFPDSNMLIDGKQGVSRWLPSIHMPKEASRLWPEVTKCYPQFLQDITGDQCLAEGITAYPEIYEEFKDTAIYDTVDELHRMVFAYIWDEANRDGAKWVDNPLVWVIEYKRVDYGPFVNGG